MRILSVCILYNNVKEVLKFANSISEQEKSENIDLVIVKNSCSNYEIDLFRKKIKNIDLNIYFYDPNENLGYLNGMFYGVKNYIKIKKLPTWVIFSNTDIQFKTRDFFEKVQDTKYCNDYYCIAPSIYSPVTDSYQNPHYKNRISMEKIKRILFITKYPLLFFIYEKLSQLRANKIKNKKEESQDVYAAHGSFFILKKYFFEELKELKYEQFLYSEEAFIAETIMEMNKKIFYDSNIEVIHTEHSTTNLIGSSKRANLINQSMNYILKKFYVRDFNESR